VRIGIVGAGTAGAAAGTLLARAGHEVTVFERVAAPAPVGAGITLQPTGQAALARLGLLAEVAARGARIDRLRVARASGRTLIDLPYADVAPGLHGIGTHRGNLFAALSGALAGTPAEVRCGIAIAGSELAPDGRWLVDAAGARHGPFDLAIAADGAGGALHACHPHVRARAYPWGAAWLVAPDPGFGDGAMIRQVVDGTHTMLGLLPTGLAPGTTTPVVSLFWSLRADRVDAWRAAGLAAWRERVLRLEPRAEPLLAAVDDLSGVLFTRYRDVAMAPWHAERLVFLGDAAHATSPQLGQGANLALVDAVALADALAAHGDVAEALAAYSRARRRPLAYYQLVTRALTPLFQGDSRALGWLRDRVFPASRWLGYLRRRMVRTMLGIDRGLLRAPLPLAALRAQLAAPSEEPAAPAQPAGRAARGANT
jgi:2-polyprenyl-6-methoxyphenol hydroxylase-like FAD-dependent oxidoreductase